MMTRTHGVTGVAVWMTGDALTRAGQLHHPYWITLAGALIAWESAKIPDVDNPDSRPGRTANKMVPGLSDTIESMFGHRGLTHWASTGIALGVALGTLASLIHPALWWIGLAIATGWLTHLAGDGCTYQGPGTTIPWKTPWSKTFIGTWCPRPRYWKPSMGRTSPAGDLGQATAPRHSRQGA